MIALTWVPEAIRLAVWVYIALGVVALLVALIKPKRVLLKLFFALVAIASFVLPPFLLLRGDKEKKDEVNAVYRQKLKAATERFEERCKGAGEKIYRKVENVDGIVWMKWREPISNAGNYAEQFKLNDPYGRDCGGDDCMVRLLRITKGAELNLESAKKHEKGYRFVETIDPTDGQRYRYKGVMAIPKPWTYETLSREKAKYGKVIEESNYEFTIEREMIDKFSARYGVIWEDISTQEDREHWIAGSSLKLIDLQNDEIIAERIGFMMDRGLGSQEGFRSPWLMAASNACPAFDISSAGYPMMISRTSWFVHKFLIPGKLNEQ